MTQVMIIRQFVNEVVREKVSLINDDEYCAMATYSGRAYYSRPTIGIPKDNLLGELSDEETKMFRRDFVCRYSSARGFANITLVLLHEIGHIKTGEQYWPNKTAEDLDFLRRAQVSTQEEYMKIPSEYGATEWAITWLQNPNNRVMAKRFERQFFNAD